MKRQVCLAFLLTMLFAVCVQPAWADERSSTRPSASAAEKKTDKDDAKKKDQDEADAKKKEEIRLEVEAKREAEKKAWLEDFDRRHGRHRHDDGGGVIVVSDADPNGGAATAYSRSYDRDRHRQKSAVGILFAPAQREKQSGFGVQYLSPRNIGATLWVSGSLGYDDDVIGGTIPHDDYWTDTSKGCYSLEAIRGFGSDDAMLILGAGIAITQTYYTDISNATGWKWEGGTESQVRPAAHASLRLRIADRVNMQFGYDTSQYAFFGISGSF
jgi:hypothetical protein